MSDCANERVFVLVIDHAPIVAFRAKSIREAIELGREAWLLEDLKHLTSDRVPLWDGKAPIRARTALPEEAARYDASINESAVERADLPLVFLVTIDKELEVSEPTAPGAFPPQR
jgi:hypothetical protein